MVAGARPVSSGRWLTFVAMIMESRLPREAIQLPMMVSDSPPLLPGTQCE